MPWTRWEIRRKIRKRVMKKFKESFKCRRKSIFKFDAENSTLSFKDDFCIMAVKLGIKKNLRVWWHPYRSFETRTNKLVYSPCQIFDFDAQVRLSVIWINEGYFNPYKEKWNFVSFGLSILQTHSFTHMYYRGIKLVTLIFVIFYRYAEL